MDAKISVIVPVYNVEKYITKCVNSLIAQTYTNLEIILVDDGSPDNCPQICDDFAKIDSRIKVIHKQNGGLSSARNVGLDVAEGDYVTFVDSDDYIMPETYSTMYDLIKREDADIVICGLDWINEDGSKWEGVEESPIKDEVLTKREVFKKLCARGYFYYVTAVNKLYKKEVFDGIRFPVSKVHEDEFTAHHIYAKCNKIVSCKNEFYKYVQHQGTIMHSGFTIKKLDAAEAFYDRYLFFKRNKEKECAKFVLVQAYSIVLQCLQQLNVNKYKKEIKPIMRKVALSLACNLNSRWLKLLLVYCKKKARETAAYYRFSKRGAGAIKKARRKYGKIAVIVATPEHGNLGDQAIVKAEKRVLVLNGFNEQAIVEIRNSDYLRFGEKLITKIKTGDLIVIDGGGNLGSLWKNEDDKITKIVSEYPNNKIIVFPQTVFYDDGIASKKRLSKNYEVYKKNKNLLVCLRDKNSYDFFQKNFDGINCVLVPDVVLSLDNLNYDFVRKGALVCLRDDIEKTLDENAKQDIKSILKKKGYEIKETSTLVDYPVVIGNREEELNKKWSEFASSEIVITDRLHAMVFSAITSTPCVALDNKSNKVSGCYEWIKENGYVKCVNSINEIETAINEVIENKGKYLGANDKFKPLIQGIRNE